MDRVIFDILKTPYGASTTTLLITLLLVWVFRKSILGLIEREIRKDVEQFKHDLNIKSELIKHDLSGEASKAKYLKSSIQEIYPELYKLLLISEGSLSNILGLRELPDWNTFNATQVETLLKDKKINEDEIFRIVTLFESTDSSRSSELQTLLDLESLASTRSEIRETKNYFILKSLFISNEVKDIVDEIFQILWSVWNDLETWLRYGRRTSGVNITNVRLELETIPSLIEALEAKMKIELFPQNNR